MLDVFRKKKRSLIIVAAFSIIILVFIFWGVGPVGRESETPGVVATVDGVEIAAVEYETLYGRQLENYRKIFKGENIEDVLGKLDLRQKTIDMLIDRVLVLNDARRNGMGVEEEEVQTSITSMAVFQKDGVFDKELYFAVLRANRINPSDFEKNVEDDLIVEKMRSMIEGKVSPSDDEVKKAFERENRQVSLDYIKVEAKLILPEVRVTEEEVRKYFDENRASFTVPTKLKALYAYIDVEEFSKGMEIPDEALKDYYTRNLANYRRPGRVKARHILIRPDPSVEDRIKAMDEARKKAEELLSMIKRGGDFAQMAKKYSQDPGSAKEGGDLGYFGRGMMVKPFEDAAFALRKGETGGIVQTDYGFHIIRADDVEKEGVVPFEEVKGNVRKTVAKEKARARAMETMSKLRELFKKDLPEERLKAEAAKAGAKAVLTGFFTENDSEVELVRDKKLKEGVFAVEENGVSPIIERENRLYIVKVAGKVKEHIPPFEEVKGMVADVIKNGKAKNLAEQRAGEFLKKAGEGEGFSLLAKEGGYKTGRTDFFTLSHGFIPGIGVFAGDREDLFLLKKEEPYYQKVVPHGDDFYIFALANAKDVPPEEFERKKTEFRESFLARRKDEALKKWTEDLRKNAKITIDRELL